MIIFKYYKSAYPWSLAIITGNTDFFLLFLQTLIYVYDCEALMANMVASKVHTITSNEAEEILNLRLRPDTVFAVLLRFYLLKTFFFTYEWAKKAQ